MIKKILLALIISFTTLVQCLAYNVCGTVDHVYDGDTFTITLEDGSVARVRMACIDAPEAKQDYGKQSGDALRALIDHYYVTLDVINTDMYGRYVAQVTKGNEDINAYMVANGYAWHYRAFDKTSSYDYYEQLEQRAREERLGLWEYDNPMEPWQYRRLKKKGML